MIYAVSVLIVVAFGILFLFYKPKIREKYAVRISDFADYELKSQSFVKSLPLPKREPAKLNDQYYASSIKSAIRKLNYKHNKKIFNDVLIYKSQIIELAKHNFDSLKSLGTINGEPRIQKLAEFCLQSCDYAFDNDRIASIFNIQNSFRTLSFEEIDSAGTAFVFVLTKRLAVLLQNLVILAKMKRLADKYTKDPSGITGDKTYKTIKHSKLFLSFCSDISNFDSEECRAYRNEFISKTLLQIKEILSCKEQIDRVDFERFYAPLQIFEKYESFCEATTQERKNFLQLVGKLSDKENIDEFLYAIRVDNYLKSANFGHIRVKRLSMLSWKFATIFCKTDITSLAVGLSSNIFMSLIFGGKRLQNSDESITKNTKNENSFAKLSKYSSVNFGISTKGDRLKLSPSLPRFVQSADLAFVHKGISHNLHIRRGDERALFLGKTKLSGTTNIVLSDRPLDVTCIVDDK